MEEGGNQDQLILAQKEALEKEIAANSLLVGNIEKIEVLEKEFQNDATFLGKVKSLETLYSGIRRVRPDGNCFFRAVGYRFFEVLLSDPKEWKRFREEAIVPSKDRMVKLGFPQFTVEDFYDTYLEAVDQLQQQQQQQEHQYGVEELQRSFNDQGQSDYIVVFLRLLTSMHLQQNADFFQHFIDGGKTVAEFCATDVEPMYQESDNIHVTALTAATGINVRIMYLDRGSNKEASPYDFPEGGVPAVHLLYRPGHYDILYPK